MDPFDSSIGFLNGRWVRADEIRISRNDVGFRSGVVVVERLRTYGRVAFQVDAHLERLAQSLESLGLHGFPNSPALASILEELIARNEKESNRIGDGVGVTILATPGEWNGTEPTLAMHLNAIDAARVKRLRSDGQPLVITDVQQPPSASWPRQMKVRSRIHYFRADQIARARGEGSIGVLVDEDGSVTETSVANLAILERGRLVSPEPSQILAGVTEGVLRDVAREKGIEWEAQRISPERLRRSDAVFLMGTDVGFWFASHVDDAPMGIERARELYENLLGGFDHRAWPDKPH